MGMGTWFLYWSPSNESNKLQERSKNQQDIATLKGVLYPEVKCYLSNCTPNKLPLKSQDPLKWEWLPTFFILESLGIIRAIWAYRHIILSYYDIIISYSKMFQDWPQHESQNGSKLDCNINTQSMEQVFSLGYFPKLGAQGKIPKTILYGWTI